MYSISNVDKQFIVRFNFIYRAYYKVNVYFNDKKYQDYNDKIVDTSIIFLFVNLERRNIVIKIIYVFLL